MNLKNNVSGFTWAQSELSLPENFTLPPELEGKIDEEQLKGLQNQTLPVVKKKCEENGGPDAYDNAQVCVVLFFLLQFAWYS